MDGERRCTPHCNIQSFFHCLVVEWRDCEPKERLDVCEQKVEAKKHRAEWCAAASKHRCVRCGRRSNMKNTRNR